MHIKQTQLEQLMPIMQDKLMQGNSVRLYPSGVSMLPMLRQGVDSVIISPLPHSLKRYDLPLYRRDNGQYVLHRIVKIDETFTCMGDNQFGKETGIRQDQMIGLVTVFYRKDKRVSVTNTGYQIYCRFWHGTRYIRRVWRKILRCLRNSD